MTNPGVPPDRYGKPQSSWLLKPAPAWVVSNFLTTAAKVLRSHRIGVVHLICLGLFSLIFAGLCTYTAASKSATFDEGIILASGHHFLRTGETTINSENPPLLKSVLAFPTLFMNIRAPEVTPALLNSYELPPEFHFGKEFLYGLNDASHILLYCRLMNVLLAIGTGILTFLLASSFSKPIWALVAAAIFFFNSNTIAHASLATLDSGVTFFMLATLLLTGMALKQASVPISAAAGAAAAFTALSKFTGVLMVPIALAQAMAFILLGPGGPASMRSRVRFSIAGLAAGTLIFFITVLAAYGFQELFHTASTGGYRSGILRGLASIPFLNRLPLPIPESYLRGFDIVSFNNGPGYPNIFLGRLYPTGGTWWYYYLVTYSIKTPLPLILLTVTGVGYALFFLGRRWQLVVFAVPVVIILFNFSFLAYRQLGLRYILPALPLCAIAASVGFRYFLSRRNGLLMTIGLAALGWVFVECFSTHPHHLAYFNQCVGGPAGGRFWTADSDLDWGQDLPGLAAWQKHNGWPKTWVLYFGEADPAFYGVRHTLAADCPDYVAISVTMNYLCCDNWQIQKILETDPVASIGHSIYIFRNIFDDRAATSSRLQPQ